jgi:hypothetical protein
MGLLPLLSLKEITRSIQASQAAPKIEKESLGLLRLAAPDLTGIATEALSLRANICESIHVRSSRGCQATGPAAK